MSHIDGDDTEAVLREWRTRTLNDFLVIVAIAMAPALVATIVNAVPRREMWLEAAVFCALGLSPFTLALLRGVETRIRLWGLLLGYTAATLNLFFDSVSGPGPLYLLALAIVALILAGVRAGVIAFDIEAVHPAFLYALTWKLLDLRLVAIDPSTNRVMVWSGQQMYELSTGDLVRVIGRQNDPC